MAGFFQKCAQVITSSYQTAGSVTRANIAYATDASLKGIFHDGSNYRDMESLLTHQIEMKACGTKRYDMYDWLMANAKSLGSLVGKRSVHRGPTITEPFIMARQLSVVNSDHWAVSTGWAASAYDALADSDSYPLNLDADAASYMGANASARVVRLLARPNSGVPAKAEFFTSKSVIYIFERNADGTASRGEWKVLYAANNTAESLCDLVIAQQGDTSLSNTTPGASTTAIALIGANNVSDWETWCANRPALNNEKRVPFWLQTVRQASVTDSLYEEWYTKMIKTNTYFRMFGDVTPVERNRQLTEMTQREWVNSVFWGQAIGAKQTLAEWNASDGLEKIYSIDKSSTYGHSNISGKEVGRRANAVGIYWQLRECGRVKDIQNQQLNLVEFFNDIHDIMRSREGEDIRESPATSIDVYTDRTTAFQFFQGMVAYYKSILGASNVQFPISPVRELNPFGFKYRSYELLHPAGVTLNIITSKFLDDFVSASGAQDALATGAGKGSAARFLMILDLGTNGIYPAITESNSQEVTTGELDTMARIDRTYACTMKVATEKIRLNSFTYTVIVECPNSNLIYENFRDVVPDHTGIDSDAYGDAIDGSSVAGSETDGITGLDAVVP